MKFYWIKTHAIIKKLFSGFVWDFPDAEKTVYLTFDDGPTREITEWVLDRLQSYNAKATFFCIGNNIAQHPGIFKKVIDAGHSIGNHTNNHLNGWNTKTAEYIENVKLCEKEIGGISRKLFRPPYGKVKPSQSKVLYQMGFKIIMWDILSADFDKSISSQKCLENVLENINPGSIIIFHDSVKAFQNLEFVLPKTLQFLKDNGYRCAAITDAAFKSEATD